VHIDRLVLSGIRRADRLVFAESMRAELGRRLGTPAAAAALCSKGADARIEFPKARVVSTSAPAGMGERVARAIARGMKS
jgi:hypothetical protein